MLPFTRVYNHNIVTIAHTEHVQRLLVLPQEQISMFDIFENSVDNLNLNIVNLSYIEYVSSNLGSYTLLLTFSYQTRLESKVLFFVL